MAHGRVRGSLAQLKAVQREKFDVDIDGVHVEQAQSDRDIVVNYFWAPSATVHGFTPVDYSGHVWLNLATILGTYPPHEQFAHTLFHEFVHVLLTAYGCGGHGQTFKLLLFQVAQAAQQKTCLDQFYQ